MGWLRSGAAELCTACSVMMNKGGGGLGRDFASGERGPAGRGDATNYLVDSVNWSHSDLANLPSVSFVSDTY